MLDPFASTVKLKIRKTIVLSGKTCAACGCVVAIKIRHRSLPSRPTKESVGQNVLKKISKKKRDILKQLRKYDESRQYSTGFISGVVSRRKGKNGLITRINRIITFVGRFVR